MSVIKFPYNKPKPERIICALCGRPITLADATIGPLNAKGEVTLLCNGHLWDGLKLINDLADYLAEERLKFFSTNNYSLRQFGISL